ncbi:VC2046/SO_2500 family protein [Dongshaea marina]|uniref:VC2046/SO_2500 family protein n=1 Tax=Dongshaea marina TaxID=2047966 RepID=UPI000D3EA485|nr:VC2046/SO_2500 family protein [Dongshaea marina]
MDIDGRSLLVHELQLGQQLNLAVHQHRRRDFALLLSLISSDPMEQAVLKATPTLELLRQPLREQFELPEPRPLKPDSEDFARGVMLRGQFESGGLAAVRLQQAFYAEPLTAESGSSVPPEVLDDVTLRSQYRYQQQLSCVTSPAPDVSMLDILDQLNSKVA